MTRPRWGWFVCVGLALVCFGLGAAFDSVLLLALSLLVALGAAIFL